MTQLRFVSEAGEFFFDAEGTVLSRFDVGYPKIGNTFIERNGAGGVKRLSPQLGECCLTVEGYILPGKLTVQEAKRNLSRIVSAGEDFILYADGLSRTVSAQSLSFDSSPGFASGEAGHFTLKLVSADAFFDGEAEDFYGICDSEGSVYFPVTFSGADPFGSLGNSGCVTVINRGDAVRGFVMECAFSSSAQALMLVSSRQEGSFVVSGPFSAGDSVIINTRYGEKSVTDKNGASLVSGLDKKCVFFNAYPGETQLRWKIPSGTSPSVKLSFTPGYLTV